MRIVLTGGGTGGHVVPNLALIEELKEKDPEIDLFYIGSRKGIDRELVARTGVPFKGIFCGKLRRYFAYQNFLDVFRVPIGLLQALLALRKFKPDVVFSKGGYVSVPVVFAARFLKIPVVLHESDVIPGLANRMCAKFADKICVSYEESKKYFPKKEAIFTGSPVRKEILKGTKHRGYLITGFSDNKPVVLIMGGSSGAKALNELTWASMGNLIPRLQIVHICGKGKMGLSSIARKLKGYKQFEYLDEELADIYAISDVIVSRAGANALAEIAALNKPAILIPLPMEASRGDQIKNSEIFAKENDAVVLDQKDLTPEKFAKEITKALEKSKDLEPKKEAIEATEKIVEILLSYS